VYPHEIRLRSPWRFRTISDPQRIGEAVIPGRWADCGLGDYWGEVELTRPFNWVAEILPHEQVFLCLDQCIGRAQVHLNGLMLGESFVPFGRGEWNVTTMLRPQNLLTVRLDAPQESPESPNRYGTHGCTVGDVDGRRRTPVGGILGGAVLSVRSRRIQFRDLYAASSWSEGNGMVRLRGEYRTESVRSPRFSLELDGASIQTFPLEENSQWTMLSMESPIENVAPWLARSMGPPSTASLTMRAEDGDELVYTRTTSVGFVERGTEARLLEPWGEIWPDRSFRPCFGENQQAPFEDWSLARWGTVRVVGHLAPDDFYRLCDRAGLLVIQDLFPAVCVEGDESSAGRSVEQVLRRLAEHPCLAAWNVSGDWERIYRSSVDEGVVEAARRAGGDRPTISLP
jgi:hypothetical protein